MADKPQKKPLAELLGRFEEVCEQSVEDQTELFLKSFIFALGDNWKDVEKLAKTYQKYIIDGGENEPDLNIVQASDFLQKNGLERTAEQRKEEIREIDLDNNNRICLLEYFLLHYKAMILTEFYTRMGESIPSSIDLSKGGVGVTGVGHQLLDELFYIPTGIPPELIAALEELTAIKKARADKIKDLQDKAAKGGVKGGIAAADLAQLLAGDLPMEFKRQEAKINSALMKSKKSTGDQALKKKKQEEEKKKKEEEAKSRAALKARASLWENK